ncbi:MAG TPA: BCD family MFS transporter [Gemmatimonadaceae bacterium]|nr:BCD family MFS transporter [Gemmatimonadaceae bacterium]
MTDTAATSADRASSTFGFFSVVRLGIVQACLGALVVLITATMNRVMVVELALPAMVPGALVALHYGVQMWLRPRMGHFADQHGRLTRWIVLGMAMLAAGVISIAMLLPMLRTAPAIGYPLMIAAFMLVGLGVSTAGTLLLTLLSLRVPPVRHARAAATVWLCMIAGFIVCTVIAGKLMTPFSFDTLVRTTVIIGAATVVITMLSLIGLDTPRAAAVQARAATLPYRDALQLVWSDPVARRFAFFVGLSMLAYSTQDLILEPFAGSVFGLTPGESTAISGVHQGGSLLGMLLTAMLSTRFGTLAGWARYGCVASAGALLLIACSPMTDSLPMLRASLFALGVANGAFAIGAIGSMMSMSAAADRSQAGVRMGVFGASQAIAMAAGGLLGAGASDAMRAMLGSDRLGYGSVFALEAALFLGAAVLASAARQAGRATSGEALLAAAG